MYWTIEAPVAAVCGPGLRNFSSRRNELAGSQPYASSKANSIRQLDGLSVQAPSMADSDIGCFHAAGLAISTFRPMKPSRNGFDAPSFTKVRKSSEMGIIDMITVDHVAEFDRAS